MAVTYVALLRGINVGGNKLVKMAELRALCESLGHAGAATHLQSGNVIFASRDDDRARVATQLQSGIKKRLGVESTVIVRTAPDLDRVVSKNPFPAEAERDPGRLVVVFLAERPTPSAAAAVRGLSGGSEVLHLSQSELYIYYPDGQGRSKLTHAVLERTLKVAGTARNWNTVIKVREMARSLAS